jgi:GNAT superfamily N-acetyltransferase
VPLLTSEAHEYAPACLAEANPGSPRRNADARYCFDVNEDHLRALASNCGGYYVAGARATGRPWQIDDDLMLSDLGLPVAAPPNNASLTRRPDDSERIARRTLEFFSASPGGGFQVWSLWPSLGLSPHGFTSFRTPCMVRDADGEGETPPRELEILEVADDAGVQETWPILNEAFLGGRSPSRLWDDRVLSDDFRIWLGRVDGRAVTTAAAFIGFGYVGIYAVATLPDTRGRGYGEAITWAATLCRPDLPATLQASEMGRPIYERMGFRTVADFTVWTRKDRVLDTVTTDASWS